MVNEQSTFGKVLKVLTEKLSKEQLVEIIAALADEQPTKTIKKTLAPTKPAKKVLNIPHPSESELKEIFAPTVKSKPTSVVKAASSQIVVKKPQMEIKPKVEEKPSEELKPIVVIGEIFAPSGHKIPISALYKYKNQCGHIKYIAKTVVKGKTICYLTDYNKKVVLTDENRGARERIYKIIYDMGYRAID